MTTSTTQEIIDIATKMAQELQDIIGDAETAGCTDPFPGTKALIDEWEEIYSQTEGHGMAMLISDEELPEFLKRQSS